MKLEHEHTRDAIARRIRKGPQVNYLRDWVYGGIDGAVTTFAIVAGVIGADLSAGVILVLGLANLLADGFSMAAANYSGTKTELDDYKRLRLMEETHIAQYPDGEREEIRQIFLAKGFVGDELERIVKLVTAHKENWIDTMLTEEHGVSLAQRSPAKAAGSTFAAFVLCGTVPLLPFALHTGASAFIATVMTAMVFFAIGSIKSRWSTQHWVWSGLETTSIGLAAAGIAWAIGHLLQGLVG
ncbi:VIT1/CCC1 transporter family protein [Breoghania sp. L-A4]|uniref:VIT1/CCC1 transporter family protein n=1 Tax=Breoghania sp. L-A4 TaxID=2304600 RepID=UPI000E35A2E8|nr:VIT1/CCC1 transporter family protein [Breoghania sp. L-A4]AXS40311.1 hypothetical protein D1F64_09895 [Breoghania sp. L-A4]